MLLLFPLLVYSQTLTAFRNQVDNGYNFWLYTPKGYDTVKTSKPIIIFLHGNSLCGNDLSRVRSYGCLENIEMGRNIDALVLAPQNPGGSWNPSRINNILTWVQGNYKVDSNRIYVIGMSLGGYGTIDFVGTYPEKIAAAMALCGGGTLRSYCGLAKVPLWILHGTADRDVSVNESIKVVEAVAACSDTNLIRFDKLKDWNHTRLARAFYVNETYDWLFSHALTDSPRTINRTIFINQNVLNAAYQNVDRSKVSLTVVDNQRGNDKVSTSSKEVGNVRYHSVKKGDTLSAIARKYHTTVAKLCKLNKMKETDILSLGRKLKVK